MEKTNCFNWKENSPRIPRSLQASANVWYQCITKSLPLLILISTLQSSFPKDADVFPSRLPMWQRVEDSPICASHDLLRLKVNAIAVSIFKPRVNSETSTAQSALNSFRRYNQASNPFLAKRILTKTHSDKFLPFERTTATFMAITQKHEYLISFFFVCCTWAETLYSSKQADAIALCSNLAASIS